MKIRYCVFCFLILFFSSATAAADQTAFKSTSNDQMAVAVTVYNNNQLAILQ